MKVLRSGKILVICALLAGLPACGFTPVYGTNSETGAILSDIEVAAPNTREEYFLVRDLEEQLGRNLSAKHILNYDIELSEQGLELAGASRSHVLGRVSYQLISKSTGQTIASGAVESFTSFLTRDNLSVAAQRDASERLIKILADKLTTDISLKLLM
ncbi:hypothetical protein HTT03_09755 [Sulfitobacter sp. S0837]|uniref:LPS assembly lipoprotein LptE n=1 Tax=Sulfitobacter maritimus TaxID=2741719 RepID=UPI0015842780|nr:LPS assembly lipoprotein LptE [Sulfitobacter maritimus]NUH63720.1 hypothetical protein [Sulfitobacter maritimus]NUH63806.1 hypothetical protein [Sulfitobacter maritimus]NUH65567.1 hypothetical protein [Sulfitobacter maritimus]